ncbi:uncharacterized protein ACB058_001051 [Synchiropus picturatus]
MGGYKYTEVCIVVLQQRESQRWSEKSTQRSKMLTLKCVLPLLTAYLMAEEVSASALPLRLKRDVSLLDQGVLQNLEDSSDLLAGDVGGASHSLALSDPLGRPSHSQQNHHQLLRKSNEHRRRKVAPLDSLSGFWKSSVRNRKEEHVTN